MDPSRAYLVCATQRSGSTLLCQLLADTGVAGTPLEFFEAMAATGRPPHPGDYLAGLPRTGAGIRDDLEPPEAPPYSSLEGLSDYEEHLERSLTTGTTPNGVFGTKLMFNQLAELAVLAGSLPRYAGLEGDALLSALFTFGAVGPRYVWVRRTDVIRQAVSMWRALQTRRWRQDADPRRDRPAQLRYSFEAIDHLVARFTAQDAGWGAHFTARGIMPLRIGYESDLERDRDGTVRRVLDYIGVAPPAGWSAAAAFDRQSDTLSDEWVAAYHRDRARCSDLAEVAGGADRR